MTWDCPCGATVRDPISPALDGWEARCEAGHRVYLADLKSPPRLIPESTNPADTCPCGADARVNGTSDPARRWVGRCDAGHILSFIDLVTAPVILEETHEPA